MREPILQRVIDRLTVSIYETAEDLGVAAASEAQRIIDEAIRERGEARVILATGQSQLTFLRELRVITEIDWAHVRVFHMDEYLGLDQGHPASFPAYLRRHLLDYIEFMAFYPIPANPSDVDQACAAYEALLRRYPPDLCALGIGENGHLAFNDPPYADFSDSRWVKVVSLAERSRLQQVHEGQFKRLVDVPEQAITLTIPALLSAKRVLAIVPEQRKAPAVSKALFGKITPEIPASVLRTAANCHLYLDNESSSLSLESAG